MIKKIVLSIAIFFSFLIDPSFAEAKKLTILFTGDMRGEIENCHCPKDDFGGLARRAEYLESLKEEEDDALLLDVGDVLPLLKADTPRKLISHSAFISFKAMGLMGYDVVNVGESDLILGEDFLKGVEKGLPFNLVSANIVRKRTNQPEFNSYVIKTMKNGLRVGIIGLTNERYVINSRDLDVGPNKDAARRCVDELREKVDLIIALGHLGIPYSIELADSVSGIDVILSGHWDAETQEPMKIGNTIIMPTSYRSRKIGRLDLEIAKGGKVSAYKWESIPLDARYDGNKIIENLISRMPDKDKVEPIKIADNDGDQVLAQQIDEIADARPVKVLVFYAAGCMACMEVKRDILPGIEKKYADSISVEHYDIGLAKNYEQMIRLEKLYGVEGGYVPEIIVSRYVLMGKEKIKADLDKVIEKALSEPPEVKKNEISKLDVAGYQPPGESLILSKFSSFSVYAVSLAGLLDGVNPCAFTTIVFFISFLSFCGYRRREMLFAGVFFTLAVFMAYLLIGLGIFKFLRTLGAFSKLSLAMNILIAGLAFLLGILSLIDYFKFRKSGNLKSITLQLPQSVKNRIHSIIGNDFRPGEKNEEVVLMRIIWIAFSAGFIVSVLESICTGQVYLPTIAYVLKMPDRRLSALAYLIIYNIAFIVPLIIVFILGLFGATSKSFAGFMERRLGLVKILTAALFFALGSILIFFK